MAPPRRSLRFLAAWLALAACGDDDPPPAPIAATSLTAGGAGVGGGISTAGDDAATRGSGTDDSGTSDDAGDTGTTPPPDVPATLGTLGSLVVLGDSTSAEGGLPPYYYDSLVLDLEVRYGPITYLNAAAPGATASDLATQIDSLPTNLPGPIAVVITAGIEDLRAALPDIAAGNGAARRVVFREDIETALDALLAPDRFGAASQVFVFEANLVDASDGAGDFDAYGCTFAQGLAPMPSTDYFAAWNLVVSDSLGERGQYLLDFHRAAMGHGYASAEPWSSADCMYPNGLGHDALRRLAYQWITGDLLP